MNLDYASDTFKGLLLLASGWLAKKFYNTIVPTFKAIGEILKIVDRVDALENKVSGIDARSLALMKTDPNPVFVTDTKGGLSYANMSWLAAMGYSDLEHAKGMNWLQAIPEEHRPRMEKLSEQQLVHRSSYEGTIPFQNIKTLVKFKAICRSEPLFDEDKIWLGTIGRLLILKYTTT